MIRLDRGEPTSDPPNASAPSDSAPSNLVRTHLATVINKLQREYVEGSAPTSWAQATLAKLRTSDIRDPGATTVSWQLVFEDLPESLAGRQRASKGERVIHQALTLYAVHQQGRRPERMHEPGQSLGKAVRRLAWIDQADTANRGVLSRFQRLCSTSDEFMRLTHLRSMITMLRGSRIALDYAQLGADLYQLLHPSTKTRVQLRWGRDFHFRPSPSTQSSNKSAIEEPAS